MVCYYAPINGNLTPMKVCRNSIRPRPWTVTNAVSPSLCSSLEDTLTPVLSPESLTRYIQANVPIADRSLTPTIISEATMARSLISKNDLKVRKMLFNKHYSPGSVSRGRTDCPACGLPELHFFIDVNGLLTYSCHCNVSGKRIKNPN